MTAERQMVKEMIRTSSNIVFFGGAGTSTESGIPDFRSAAGLFQTEKGKKYSPEEVLSRDFFYNQVEEFYKFYKTKMLYPHAKPNAAHHMLAQLEQDGQLRAVITQNIDGLHQQAGSKNVLELHGTVMSNHCVNCHNHYPLSYILESEATVPHCRECGGIVKPDVVLYQESLDEQVLWQAIDKITQAETLIVAGTSLTVHPAAGLVRYYTGDQLILINQSSTPFDSFADYVLPYRISEVLQ